MHKEFRDKLQVDTNCIYLEDYSCVRCCSVLTTYYMVNIVVIIISFMNEKTKAQKTFILLDTKYQNQDLNPVSLHQSLDSYSLLSV